MIKPNEIVKVKEQQNARDRIIYCARMLYYHGFISESENEKVKKRIRKWLDQHDQIAPGTADKLAEIIEKSPKVEESDLTDDPEPII